MLALVGRFLHVRHLHLTRSKAHCRCGENQVQWASLQSYRLCCLEQSPRLHSVWVKHQTFQETSQNWPVYIVILIFYLFYCFSQHEMSAGLFFSWTISLDDDDDDDDDVKPIQPSPSSHIHQKSYYLCLYLLLFNFITSTCWNPIITTLSLHMTNPLQSALSYHICCALNTKRTIEFSTNRSILQQNMLFYMQKTNK